MWTLRLILKVSTDFINFGNHEGLSEETIIALF